MKPYIFLLVLTIIVAACAKKEVVHTKHETDGEHNPHFDHEAIIGSKKMEEEFDEMSPTEAKRRLGLLVAEHDKNKDNVITREELVQWLLDSFRQLDEEEALEKMDEDDANDDHQVSWKEMVKQQYSYDLEDIEDFKKHPDKQEKEMREFLEMLDDEENRFIAADENTNGFLDKKEYMAYYHPNEYPHMFDTEIKRALKHSDKNEDGFISKEEYVGGVTDQESRIAEEENFRSYDANGDGKLDRTEMQRWVIQDNKEAAKEEAHHLFNLADENKNNELALIEILEHHEDFVGSQATDYGRHLEDEL